MKNLKRAGWMGIITALMIFVLSPPALAQSAQKPQSQFANLVIFAQFSDTDGNFMDSAKVANAQKFYTDTSHPKSLVSYIDTISYGQLHIETTMPQLSVSGSDANIVPITLSGTMASYGENSYKVAKEAMEAVKAQIPKDKRFDLNGDGIVDNVTFIFEGSNQERGTLFYPHKENFSDPTYTINGSGVSTINVLMAEDILGYGSLGKEGVICHEFMHSLGYPDLYKEVGGSPVGPWDLMANATTFAPWPLAYLRSQVSGWLTMDTITQSTTHLELVPASQANGSQAYILKSPISDSEFFVVEYRKQGARYTNELDVKIPGSGLIIYRINTKVENLNNRTSTVDGVYVFRKGETSVTAATTANMNQSYFSQESGRTAFGSLDLDVTISDNALVYSDGQNSGIQISNIGSAGDTISFDVTFADTSEVGVWETLGNANVSEQSSGMIDMDSDSKGNIYILNEQADDWPATLRLNRWNAATEKWETVGPVITDYGSTASLAIYGDTPYLFYNENKEYGGKLVKWDELTETWKSLGITQEKNINDLDLSAGNTGLFLAYAADSGSFSNTLYYAQSSGEDGITAIGTDSQSGYFSQLHLSAEGNRAYFSCRDATNQNQVLIRTLTSSGITPLNAPAYGYSDPQIKAIDGKIYLLGAIQNNTKTSELYCYTATGNWEQIGDSLPRINSNTSAFTVYKGVPIVQVVNQGEGKQNTTVWRYDSSAWVQEGLPLDSTGASDSEIAIVGDKAYVALLSSVNKYDFYPVVKSKHLVVNTPEDPEQPEEPVIVDLVVTPIKTSYEQGQSFNPEDITVSAAYSNNINQTIANGDGGYSISGFDTATVGKKSVTIAYDGKTTVYEITVEATKPLYLLGDVNADGLINASDALQDLRHSVKEIELVGEEFTRGDVIKNEVINASDALQILRYSVKEINEF